MASSRLVLVCIVLFVAAVSAQFDGGYGGYGGGDDEGQGGHGHGHQDYFHHPKYQYQYGVHDDHTHDIKKHTESRDGDKTEGEYSFKEADGTTRVVKYHVHGKSGFVATVHHTGHATHPQPTHHQESGHHDGGFAGYAGYNGGQY